MTWYTEWFGQEYLQLYAHRDEAEARQQVEFFCKAACKSGGVERGTVLDLACGQGRHTEEFLQRGFRVVGSDLSYTLLRSGVRESGPMPLVCADMRQLPFRNETFSALVNFFTSFGYFEEESENVAAIKEMSRVIKRGAPFLFDYLNVDRELRRLVTRERRDTDLGAVEIERWFDGASRTFNKRITIGGRRFLERVRGYHVDELSRLFQESGLAVRQICGGFDGTGFDVNSDRLVIVGERIG